jgi:hypothetical protein
MADYLPFTPIPLDSATLKMRAYQRMADRVPGWLPSPAEPETWIIDDYAENLVEVAVIAQQIPAAIVRWGGRGDLRDHPPGPDRGARRHHLDDARHSRVHHPRRDRRDRRCRRRRHRAVRDQPRRHRPPRLRRDRRRAVEIVATEPGERGSGLTAAPQTALDFVQSIAIVGQTTGGTDGETDEQYLDRVARERQLPGTPVRAEHLELLARSVPGVVRAFGIDGYIPGPPRRDRPGESRGGRRGRRRRGGRPLRPQSDDPRAAPGAPRGELPLQRHQPDLHHRRRHVHGGRRVGLGRVRCAGARAVTALQDYLSPAVWPWGGTVRRRELEGVLNVVDGLDYVSSLTLGVSGQAQSTNDLAIAGAAPLTRPGTITPTVTAP